MREEGILRFSDDIIRASTPLGAGIGLARTVCGCLTTGALAIGLRYGRLDLTQSRQPSWERAHRLVHRFEAKYGTVICADIVPEAAEFADRRRIRSCAEIIRWTTAEVKKILEAPDSDFFDAERQSYFRRRETGGEF